jgi:hypothetical protein
LAQRGGINGQMQIFYFLPHEISWHKGVELIRK